MSNLKQFLQPLSRGTFRLIAFGAAFATLLAAQFANADDVVTSLPQIEIIIPPMPELPVAVDANQVAVAQAATEAPVDGWSIQISPRKEAVSEMSDELAGKVAAYNAAYKAIPYRRAEYLANPGYRHDTAVEMAFGQMRQTVIHRNSSPETIVNERPSLYRQDMFPYIGDYKKFYWEQGLYTLRYYPNPVYPSIMVRN